MSEDTQAQAGDPLAAALVPVLMHRLNNATQLLQTLGSLVALEGGRDWIGERSEDLLETSSTVGELGYLLAVLASAGGADLLQERRDPRGLATLAAAARDALRREGRRIAAPAGELPDLAPSAGRGWEAPWAAAAFLLAAGRDAPADGELVWELAPEGEGALLTARVKPGAALRKLAPLLSARTRALHLELGEHQAQLAFPAGWLVFRAAD